MIAPRKILVRGVNWLGDAIMATPALQRLREAHPQAHIALLTHEKLASLWANHPSIDQVITFAKGDSPWTVSRKLRPGRFDAALVLPNSTRSALEIRLAGIPRRVGVGGRLRQFLLTECIAPRTSIAEMRKRTPAEIQSRIASGTLERDVYPEGSHHIHHYLHLARAFGASTAPCPPLIKVTDQELQAFGERFEISQSPARPLLGLNPGAEYGPAKRWPAENFIAAAEMISKAIGAEWVVFGGNGDAEICAHISSTIEAKGIACRDLSSKTNLRELACGLKSVQCLLTNDTGPMHLAAAVGTPVVALFGSTSWELTGPGLPNDPKHSFIYTPTECAPCFLRECPVDFRCMKGITMDQVVQAVLRNV